MKSRRKRNQAASEHGRFAGSKSFFIKCPLTGTTNQFSCIVKESYIILAVHRFLCCVFYPDICAYYLLSEELLNIKFTCSFDFIADLDFKSFLAVKFTCAFFSFGKDGELSENQR